MPGGRVREVLAEMVQIWAELDALEREHRLDFLREPDLGFAWAAYRWAEGDELDDVLGETDLAAGDFVRWVKQLLDLADQVADAAGDTPLRRTAREAVHALMRRGVVAYSVGRAERRSSASAGEGRPVRRSTGLAQSPALGESRRAPPGRAGRRAASESGVPRSRSRATATTVGATSR